jgi:hypothetical protein
MHADIPSGYRRSPWSRPRDAGDRHAFDQHEGIAFHDHAVGEGAAVAFVGIADDVFAVARGIEHRLPLDAGREAGAAAAAQAGFGHLGDHVGRRHASAFVRPFRPPWACRILQRQRIVTPQRAKGQPRLLGFRKGILSGVSQTERVVAAGEEACIEQAFDVGRLDRPIGDPAIGRVDFDHRLEPIGAARTVAHDLGIDAADGNSLANRLGDLFGAERQRTGIARERRSRDHERTSATISSSFSSSSRPMHLAIEHRGGCRRNRARDNRPAPASPNRRGSSRGNRCRAGCLTRSASDGVRTHRLAGLGLTELQHMPAGRVAR